MTIKGKTGIAICLSVPVFGACAYGLIKMGMIPAGSLALRMPAVTPLLRVAGLMPAPQSVQAAAATSPAPVAAPSGTLRADPEPIVVRHPAPPVETLDTRSIARMAAIYDQMPPETVTRIFARLPDKQVIAMLRRMEEKQVAQILAIESPERAARLTLSLTRPAQAAAERMASLAKTP